MKNQLEWAKAYIDRFKKSDYIPGVEPIEDTLHELAEAIIADAEAGEES